MLPLLDEDFDIVKIIKSDEYQSEIKKKYKYPNFRISNDIDFYVDPDNTDKALNLEDTTKNQLIKPCKSLTDTKLAYYACYAPPYQMIHATKTLKSQQK